MEEGGRVVGNFTLPPLPQKKPLKIPPRLKLRISFSVPLFLLSCHFPAKRPVIPKIYYTYPKMTKLAIIIPYLGKNQKTYESRHTVLEVCLHQRFFQRKSANFAKLRNTDMDCILIHDFKLF